MPITTYVCFLKPALNAFFLFSFGVPMFWLIHKRIYEEVSRYWILLAKMCMIILAIAVICWIADKLFCSLWLSIGFPYLHSIWHILICIATCKVVVLFAYLEIAERKLTRYFGIRYWPVENYYLGIAYINVK